MADAIDKITLGIKLGEDVTENPDAQQALAAALGEIVNTSVSGAVGAEVVVVGQSVVLASTVAGGPIAGAAAEAGVLATGAGAALTLSSTPQFEDLSNQRIAEERNVNVER
jgi:hypothetical protein